MSITCVPPPPHKFRRAHLPIKVVGDKHGGRVAQFFSQKDNLENFKRLNDIWNLNTHFICILRNPFDVITTLCLRGIQEKYALPNPKGGTNIRQLMQIITEQGLSNKITNHLPEFIDRFARRCHGVQVLSDSALFPVYFVHYADLTTNTKEVIGSLTEFLGVVSADEYLQACAKLVKPASNTRFLSEQLWSEDHKAAVQLCIDKYHWLQRYTFDE